MNLLEHSIVTESFLFPRNRRISEVYEIETTEGKLACLYRRHKGASKTLVHFHGNAECVADYEASLLNTLSCDILYVEYPGYGASEGEATLLSLLRATESLVKELEIDDKDLVFFGRSLGSLYALHAASIRPGAHALVLESGIADLIFRFEARGLISKIPDVDIETLREEITRYFDYRTKLAAFKGKTLVLHTAYDSVVPSFNAVDLHAYASIPKKLNIFVQGDHNDILHRNKHHYLESIREFVLEE